MQFLSAQTLCSLLHHIRRKARILCFAPMRSASSCYSASPATGAGRASYGGPTCGKVGRGPAPLGTAANSSAAQASSSGSGCAPSTASAMRSALYSPLRARSATIYHTFTLTLVLHYMNHHSMLQ